LATSPRESELDSGKGSMKTSHKKIWPVIWILFQIHLPAQLPSECLLIINASSPRAVEVSLTYAQLRGFPLERLLILRPPSEFFQQETSKTTKWVVSESEVQQVLLKPIEEKLEELRDPFPTALIFSPDWPTQVNLQGKPSVSLTSYIGFLGEMPKAEMIKGGRAVSPWYRHPPDLRKGKGRMPKYPAKELKGKNVHPAAMLGVFYEPLSVKSLKASLERAVKADHTKPKGHMVLITNQDVRTRARLDQFEPAKAELQDRGQTVLLGTNKDPLPETVLAVMTGAAKVNTSRFKGKLAPGSFAEHLTSFAGTFQNPHQTKMTKWIGVGAAGTVGTVVEPFAIWTKFPRVAVLERYAQGATLLEALSTSIASPYQALIIGDPLCRPWGAPLPVDIETEWNGKGLQIKALAGHDPDRTDHHLFVDGTQVNGNGPVWTVPINPSGRKGPVEVILHARYNWSPPETGWVKKTVTLPSRGKGQRN